MTLTIFTSLPPTMNRFDDAGANIGMDHFRACLTSWRQCAFDIVSVNSESETQSPFESEFGVRRINLSRDAKNACGKPLIYFSDFVRAIADHATGPIIITNADIELNISADDFERIAGLQRGTFICERRLDYDDKRRAEAQPYLGGFDFFVVHRDDLELIADNEFVFGMPWWDHYIPVTLLAHNFRQVYLSARSQIYHREHSERWEMTNFFQFGYQFRASLDVLANSKNLAPGFLLMLKRLTIIEHRLPHYPYPRRQNFFRNLFRIAPADPVHNHMLWIAFFNLRLVSNPFDAPMGRLNISRFLQRLPL